MSASPSGRVIVVGSVNVDLIVRTTRLPSPGETVTGGTFEQQPGGKGGNQAVAAARLGRPVSIVGAVGDDPFGAEARESLAGDQVDIECLLTVPGTATGVALILVDASGENAIAVASGANHALPADHVRRSLAVLALGPGDVLLVSAEIPDDATREALRSGRAAGATRILNPAPAAGMHREVFALADLITPNRGELAELVAAEGRRIGRAEDDRAEPGRLARTLLAPNAEGPGVERAVVVTLGSEGALLVERVPEGVRETPVGARQVGVVDSTGAGDAFNGALAAALAEGRLLGNAVTRAVAAATLSTLAVGARAGLPTSAELDRALAG